MVSRSAMGSAQISSASCSSRSACARASISRPRSLLAAPTAIPATSRRRLSLARVVSSSICCCAAATIRAPSELAAPLACSITSLARCCAWSMIWLARSRASRMMASALSRAWDSSFSPSSAAARPCAILRWRSSIAARICGQIHFIVPQMSVANTTICTTSVRLMFTLRVSVRGSESGSVLNPAEERVCEREEQRETDADHRHRIEQTRHQEHLHAQHRQQLRLARRALDEAAAENAKADGGAERAAAEDDADGQHGHGLDVCNAFHSTLLQQSLSRCRNPQCRLLN